MFGDDPATWPKNLAVEMYSHVQGRTDANKAWDVFARKILKTLDIVPTRGDQSLFAGQIKGNPALVMKATDDFGVGTSSPETYQTIVTTFKNFNLIVHDIGEMSFYFGTRVIISSSCISLDHKHLIEQSLVIMFGKSWKDQYTSGLKIGPLPGRSKYELMLLSATPFTKLEK